jgi:DNA excision repair protein ERCC-4
MAGKYTIIKDTREQQGWDFPPRDSCAGMEIGTLRTGDYTLKGSENLICIERKKTPTEVAGNLGRKKKPFEAEMQRMSKFKYPFIICEFSMTDLLEYPENSSIPMSKRTNTMITGRYMLRCLLEYQLEYNIKILFCDNATHAATVAASLMKRLHENITKKTE